MDDIKLDLLGDKEAAKRLTEQGVLLGCPFCGGEVRLRKVSSAYSTSPNDPEFDIEKAVAAAEKWDAGASGQPGEAEIEAIRCVIEG